MRGIIWGAMATGLVALGTPTKAAPTFYFDEAGFAADLALLFPGGIDRRVETFEGEVEGDTGATSFISSAGFGFTLDGDQTTLAVDDSGLPSSRTSGFKALGESFAGGAPGEFGYGSRLDIDLGGAFNAFSAFLEIQLNFDILPTDLTLGAGGQSMSIPAGLGDPVNDQAAVRFLGIIDDDTAFDSVSVVFDSTSSVSVGVLDDLTTYRASGAPPPPVVPLPPALPALAIAMAVLGWLGGAGRRRPA
jgi:hypothetical protein